MFYRPEHHRKEAPVDHPNPSSPATPPLDETARRRLRQRLLCEPLAPRLDLDVFRGWREERDPSLSSSHLLPALARLSLLKSAKSNDEVASYLQWTIYGPRIYLGRYHSSAGPVDIFFDGLLDHELYRINAPHALLELGERGFWTLKALSRGGLVAVDGETIEPGDPAVPVGNRQRITLGVAQFRFDILGDGTLTSWTRRLEDQLRVQENPALFLKRQGGICGPRYELKEGRAAVIGRSFPRERDLSRPGHWNAAETLDWDLSGLREHERRHIGFRHAIIRPRNDHDWEIEALSLRHKLTVNRLPVTEPKLLQSGDEIGLGSIVFQFHHPNAGRPSSRATVKLPNPVDWHHEQKPTKPPELPGKRNGPPPLPSKREE